jgi:hypothetical protein
MSEFNWNEDYTSTLMNIDQRELTETDFGDVNDYQDALSRKVQHMLETI